MSTWFNYAAKAPGILGGSKGRSLAALVAAVSLSILALPTDTPANGAEGSVLVATREGATSQEESIAAHAGGASAPDADGETLEPISQVADRTPELAEAAKAQAEEPAATAEQRTINARAAEVRAADDAADDAGEFGAALAKVAQSDETKTSEASRNRSKSTIGRYAPPETVRVPYEPAKFHGVEAGKSSHAELLERWGQPAQSVPTDDGAVLTFDMEPFQTVEVLVQDDMVSAIKIALAADLEPKQLAKQLSLDAIVPVTVADDDGRELGMAFPERGVLFVFTAPEEQPGLIQAEAKQTVSQVVIQPLDARAFVLRAESHLRGPYQQNVRDLKTALALEPELAHAHWLLAEIYLETGQADLADEASADACELEPTNGTYQLCRARAQALLGQYDEAVHIVRSVLDEDELPTLVRAQALHEMARLASLGDVEIAAKAIPFEMKAIELADKLATTTNVKDRRAAKQLLVEAHLAIAEEVARQAFNNKVEALSMWVGRASGLAEDFIEDDGGSVELRLKVAQSALAALASFKPTLDPAPWIAEAEEAAKELAKGSDEELWQQHVQWELGIAYFHALRVEHLRQQTAKAESYGQQAIAKLAEGATSRQAVHSSEQLVGQLYFYMGAIHAVHEQDHKQAAEWYDKAAPLLTGPRPVSELYSPRREGEVLVSMGVTYWQLGQQTKALELTQAGANLVELAVEDGILATTALAVPYGNLASMYEQMGEATNASKYAEKATSASKSSSELGPRPRQTSSAVRTASMPGEGAAARMSGGQPMRMNGQQPRPSRTMRR